jgi:hypothetical protein
MEYIIDTDNWTCGGDGDSQCSALGPEWKYYKHDTAVQGNFMLPCGFVHSKTYCTKMLPTDVIHQGCLSGCVGISNKGHQYCPDGGVCEQYMVTDAKDYLKSGIPKADSVIDWTVKNPDKYENIKAEVCDGTDPSKTVCYDWCNKTKKCTSKRKKWCTEYVCKKRSDLPIALSEFKQWGTDVIPTRLYVILDTLTEAGYNRYRNGDMLVASDFNALDPNACREYAMMFNESRSELMDNLLYHGPCIEKELNITNDRCNGWCSDETNVTDKKVYWQARCDYCKDKINTPQCLNWSNDEDMISNAPDIKYQYDTYADDYCKMHPSDSFCSCTIKDPSNVIDANPYCFNFACINDKNAYRNKRYFEKKDSSCPNLCLQAITVNGTTSIINNISMIQNCSGFGDAKINQKIMEAVKAEVKDSLAILASLMYLTGDNSLENELSDTKLSEVKKIKMLIDDIPNKIVTYPDVYLYPSYISLTQSISSVKSSLISAHSTYNEIVKLDWTKADKAADTYSSLRMKFGNQLQGYSNLINEIKNWSDDVFIEFTREANSKANIISTLDKMVTQASVYKKSYPNTETYDILALHDEPSVRIVMQKAKQIEDSIEKYMTLVFTDRNKNKVPEQISTDIILINGRIEGNINKMGEIKYNEIGFKRYLDRWRSKPTDINELSVIEFMLSTVFFDYKYNVIVDPVEKPKTKELPGDSNNNNVFWILVIIALVIIISIGYYIWTSNNLIQKHK